MLSYIITSAVSFIVGIVVYRFFIRKELAKLQAKVTNTVSDVNKAVSDVKKDL